MASRRPLVEVNGTTRQLPSGDTLDWKELAFSASQTGTSPLTIGAVYLTSGTIYGTSSRAGRKWRIVSPRNIILAWILVRLGFLLAPGRLFHLIWVWVCVEIGLKTRLMLTSHFPTMHVSTSKIKRKENEPQFICRRIVPFGCSQRNDNEASEEFAASIQKEERNSLHQRFWWRLHNSRASANRM